MMLARLGMVWGYSWRFGPPAKQPGAYFKRARVVGAPVLAAGHRGAFAFEPVRYRQVLRFGGIWTTKDKGRALRPCLCVWEMGPGGERSK